MSTSAPAFFQRSVLCAATVILVAAMTACTGTGGGKLPPSPGFTGPASFGFDFSCERSSRSVSTNPPAGQLRIQLSYTEHGAYGPLGSPFTIHGIVDRLDPVLESMICSGQEPSAAPNPNELIFLGRYWPATSAPAGLEACPKRDTSDTPLCRFEVFVRDNDRNLVPSTGDFFSVTLSSATESGTPSSSELDVATVLYIRAGLLEGGNINVE